MVRVVAAAWASEATVAGRATRRAGRRASERAAGRTARRSSGWRCAPVWAAMRSVMGAVERATG